MKVSLSSMICSSILVLSSSVLGFVAQPMRTSRHAAMTKQFMFGGAGAGSPTEDSPEQLQAMENAAKSLGMSLDEYKLGIRARMKLVEDLDKLRVTGGSAGAVQVERDGNNPPKHLVITISESAKASGKEVVAKDLISAYQTASEASKNGRMNAQKNMVAFIGEQLKGGGAK